MLYSPLRLMVRDVPQYRHILSCGRQAAGGPMHTHVQLYPHRRGERLPSFQNNRKVFLLFSLFAFASSNVSCSTLTRVTNRVSLQCRLATQPIGERKKFFNPSLSLKWCGRTTYVTANFYPRHHHMQSLQPLLKLAHNSIPLLHAPEAQASLPSC